MDMSDYDCQRPEYMGLYGHLVGKLCESLEQLQRMEFVLTDPETGKLREPTKKVNENIKTEYLILTRKVAEIAEIIQICDN